MNYIKKTIIVSFIFSFFLLIVLQFNKVINKKDSDKQVLGVTSSDNNFLCTLINSLRDKYCVSVVVSSTMPATNIGSNKTNIPSYEIYDIKAVSDNGGKTTTIIFNSKKPLVAKVEYGTTAASMSLMTAETDSTTNHKFSLSPLRPNTTYYYRIRIGAKVFDNNGIPYTFKTRGQ